MDERILRCEECHREADADARAWRALIVPPDGNEPPEAAFVAVYCPECAEREFGPVRTHAEAGPG